MSNDDQFPMMLYKAPGRNEVHGMMLDHVLVHNADELEEKLEQGWFEKTTDAHAAYVREQARAAEERAALANTEAAARANSNAPDTAPPTRAELELKARELGIAFNGKTTDAALSKLIDGKTAP